MPTSNSNGAKTGAGWKGKATSTARKFPRGKEIDAAGVPKKPLLLGETRDARLVRLESVVEAQGERLSRVERWQRLVVNPATLASILAVLYLLLAMRDPFSWSGGLPSHVKKMAAEWGEYAGSASVPVTQRMSGEDVQVNVAGARALAADDERVSLRPSSSRGMDRRGEGPVAATAPSVIREKNGVARSPFLSPAFVGKKSLPRSMIEGAAATPPAVKVGHAAKVEHASDGEEFHGRKARLTHGETAHQSTDDDIDRYIDGRLFVPRSLTSDDPSQGPVMGSDASNLPHSYDLTVDDNPASALTYFPPSGPMFYQTYSPTGFPTGSPMPTHVCSAEEPCGENHFCNFKDASRTNGYCQVCPSKKLTCNEEVDSNEGIADCALRCDEGLVCGNNYQTCGCSVVAQSDYRGSISITEKGEVCKNWDQYSSEYYPCVDYPGFDAGEHRNYCRNPGEDVTLRDHKPFCITHGENGYGSCDIPLCDPCSCEPPSCEDFETLESCHCTEVVDKIAKKCCPEDADDFVECNCNHRMAACRTSLRYNNADYCDDVIDDCCEEHSDSGACKCEFLESLCHDNPDHDAICEKVPSSCCHYVWGDLFKDEDYDEDYDYQDYEYLDNSCQCDWYKYAEKSLDIELSFRDLASKSGACFSAQSDILPNREEDHTTLKRIYESTNGKYWYNNTGWLDSGIAHCDWSGVTCNKKRFVIKIDLTDNNLTGTIDEHWNYDGRPLPIMLETLILKKNKLSGPPFQSNLFFSYRQLTHVDLSQNNLSGAVDILVFPAAEHLDFSHNQLTYINKYKRFSPANEVLRFVDLSNNMIEQDASDIFENIPPNIEELDVSNNRIGGQLPQHFPALSKMTRLAMNDNRMNGTLPDARQSFLRLRKLDLSNQKKRGGFTGPIPGGFSNKFDLTELNLANNRLDKTVPSYLGSLPILTSLNLSNNTFTGCIPDELGNLGVAELLDLSNNKLNWQIPSSLGNLRGATVRLSGNSDIMELGELAPLSLCEISDFDLQEDTRLCPPERSALQDIFDTSSGGEWTNSTNWLDEFKTHCDWYGVTCNDFNNVINLTLRNNALSGRLSEDITTLRSIKVLDLSDNDIKGSIPPNIQSLSSLTTLRLSYNVFVGTVPTLANLKHLKVIHLHGNRLHGTIPPILGGQAMKGKFAFIADCGVPSIFSETLGCEQCTMCCNSQGSCYPTEETLIQKVDASGFKDYTNFTWVLFLSLLGLCCILHLASFFYQEFKNRHLSRERRQSVIDRDTMYACVGIGEDSVYQFFLGKSWLGWIVALAVMAFQISILSVFVEAAEFDLKNDNTDLIYTWTCSRNSDGCRDTADVDNFGKIVFGILMAIHLLKDIINASKLVILSGKGGVHSRTRRVRFFLGGMILSSVSLFTLYASVIYNKAIATSDTDIIANSVIILFVTDIDEMVHRILMVINSKWVKSQIVSGQKPQPVFTSETEERLQTLVRENTEMKVKVNRVEGEMDELREKMLRMEENVGLVVANPLASKVPQADEVKFD